MSRLEGKVAIVTGGARGIGAAVAELFVREGAEVVSADIDPPSTGSRSAIEERELDTTDLDGWSRLIEGVEKTRGSLDVLVNNAGIVGSYAPIEDIELTDWDRVIAVNQTGAFYGMRTAIGPMRRAGGGSIVNVSSMWGIIGARGVAAYQASKGAVRTMTKNVALSYAEDGIRVNSIHPGIVDTPLVRAQDKTLTAEVVAATPLGRIGRPEEVAKAALFLACDDSSFITGAELLVDGGYTIQ